MTEHEPECPCIDKAEHPDGCLCCEVASPCICDRLRACEERVLDAARNALAALRGCIGTDGNGDGTVSVEKFNALSAIYALREGNQP